MINILGLKLPWYVWWLIIGLIADISLVVFHKEKGKRINFGCISLDLHIAIIIGWPISLLFLFVLFFFCFY